MFGSFEDFDIGDDDDNDNSDDVVQADMNCCFFCVSFYGLACSSSFCTNWLLF